MIQTLIGIVLVLHGVVHGIYVGQSLRLFELQPGMVWPENSLLLSKIFDQSLIRWIGGVSLSIAALLFILGGAALLFNKAWFKPIILAACLFATLLYLLFWDGSMEHLDNQGFIGILINIAIVVAMLLNIPTIDG